MSERRTIGQILISVGRITEGDVATALEYQRDHGGYFGEALLACGLVTADELEWGLASQFDLPYVFPEADAVDPEAAALVSPEWALAHLTLPIMRTERSLKVVVDSPLKTEPIDELRERTELEVELALASPATIRELIRQVYARASASDEERRSPVDLTGALDAILRCEAPRFGISVRGTRSYVWWDDRGTIRRRPLAGDWRSELEEVVDPGPAQKTKKTNRTGWEAELHRAGSVLPLDVSYMADESGREYLFRPRRIRSSLEERFPPPASGVISETRLLARSGTARFIVTAQPPEVGQEILPHLPSILLDPSWRSVHVSLGDRAGADEAFGLRVPKDPATWATEIEQLRAFHFDVVTVDLTGAEKSWTESALDIASVAFLLWPDAQDPRPAYEAGIRWQIRIERDVGDHLEWSLEPLHA
jgi:hypothetical protein